MADAEEAGAQGALLRVRRTVSVEWPEKGCLAKAWEGEPEVRRCFRDAKSHLLVWPSVQLVGAASMRALSMNVPIIQVALQIWGGFSQECKAMPIDWLKQEVQELHGMLNPATTNRQDRNLHVLFDTMTQSWGQDPYLHNDEENEEAAEELDGEPLEDPEPPAPSEADRGAGPAPDTETADSAAAAGAAEEALMDPEDELASLQWQLRVMENLSGKIIVLEYHTHWWLASLNPNLSSLALGMLWISSDNADLDAKQVEAAPVQDDEEFDVMTFEAIDMANHAGYCKPVFSRVLETQRGLKSPSLAVAAVAAVGDEVVEAEVGAVAAAAVLVPRPQNKVGRKRKAEKKGKVKSPKAAAKPPKTCPAKPSKSSPAKPPKTSPAKPLKTSPAKPPKSSPSKPDKKSPKAKTSPSEKSQSKHKPDQGAEEAPRAKRTRLSDEDKSFARRAKPQTEDAVNQWTAIRDAYNAVLSLRFGAGHQDDFWQTVKPTLMKNKKSPMETYSKIAKKAAQEYLAKVPLEIVEMLEPTRDLARPEIKVGKDELQPPCDLAELFSNLSYDQPKWEILSNIASLGVVKEETPEDEKELLAQMEALKKKMSQIQTARQEAQQRARQEAEREAQKEKQAKEAKARAEQLARKQEEAKKAKARAEQLAQEQQEEKARAEQLAEQERERQHARDQKAAAAIARAEQLAKQQQEAEEAKARAEQLAKQQEAEEAKARAEQLAKQQQEAEEAKARAEQLAKQQEAEEAKARAEQLARKQQEAEAKARAEQLARKQQEAEAKARVEQLAKEQQEAEEAKARAEQLAREQQEAEEAKARAEQLAREQLQAEEAKARAEQLAKEQLQAEEAKARAEQLAREQQDALRRQEQLQLLRAKKAALAEAQAQLQALETQCWEEDRKAAAEILGQVTPPMPGAGCKPELPASPAPLQRTTTPTEAESPLSSWSQDAQPRELFPASPTPPESTLPSLPKGTLPSPPKGTLPSPPKGTLPSPPTVVSAVKSAPSVPKHMPAAIAASQSMPPPPTDAAINRRLSRAMEPNARGEFKIAERIRKQWHDGGDSKDGVIRLFAKCGYNTDGDDIDACVAAAQKDPDHLIVASAKASITDEFSLETDTDTMDLNMDLGGSVLQHPSSERPASLDDAADGILHRPPANEETARLLKRLGYPEIAEATRMMTKVVRMYRNMDDCCDALTKFHTDGIAEGFDDETVLPKKDVPTEKAPACIIGEVADAVVSDGSAVADPNYPKSHQRHNNKGHSFLSRFLICAVPSKTYKKNSNVLPSLLKQVSQELKVLFESGLTHSKTGIRYRFVLIGAKGDAEWHFEAGNFNRSYHRTGPVNALKICPLCDAGAEGIPYSDVSSAPEWLRTVGSSEPWLETPPLNEAPFSVRANLYKFDPFHVLKFGIFRDAVASTIIRLAFMGFFDFTAGESRGVPERLLRAFSLYKLWCLAEKKNPSLKTFSRANMNFDKNYFFAWINCKGSEVVLLMQWLAFLLPSLEPRQESEVVVLKAMSQMIEGGLCYIGVMHSHGLWLPRCCARVQLEGGFSFVRGYAWMAQYCTNAALPGYRLRPKLHYMMHILMDAQSQYSQGAEFILSSSIHLCEMDEDYIDAQTFMAEKERPVLW
ncbi:unnamed protein product [Symbiodinium microadriaticum]|nr:unnamed protein product [Symbiodinium microadriaticum]